MLFVVTERILVVATSIPGVRFGNVSVPESTVRVIEALVDAAFNEPTMSQRSPL